MNDLATRPEGTPAWESKLELIKKTVAKDTTNDELELFLYQARRTGLDPLSRQIHCIVRGQGQNRKATIQTGIDGYRLIADRTGLYAGSDDYRFDEGLSQYQHLGVERGHPKTATVTVWKIVQGQRVPFTASCHWAEYYPGDGNAGFMWRKMPYLMLGKTAEALALRKAFPAELSGIYTHEEMAQAGGSAPYPEDDVIDVSPDEEPDATGLKEPQQARAKPAKTEPWQRWSCPEDAILWADDQLDERGERLFNATKHTENAYAAAKREYQNALGPEDKPNARDMWRYWYLQTLSRKQGQKYVIEPYGSQLLPFDGGPIDEGTSFEDLGKN